MKKIAILFNILLVLAMCCACTQDNNLNELNETSDHSKIESEVETPQNSITFEDAVFEKQIRKLIKKPTGEILQSDVSSIEKLDLGELGIINISGIEHFTSLKELDLRENKIINVDDLASLTELTFLRLSKNYISDISALGPLTKLDNLELDNNYISDISVVVNFLNLQYLGLTYTNVSDISPLRNLKNLSSLPSTENTPVWDYNPLTDILDDIINNYEKSNPDLLKEDIKRITDDIKDIHNKNIQAGNVVKTTLSKLINPEMSELEKEFAIFNYIVSHIEYEFGGYDGYSNSDLYNIFINRKGICNHYARAFSILCNAAEVECYTVQGSVNTEDMKDLGHDWNIVKIGENYYQVDATWADQDPIQYDFFNRSTQVMNQIGFRKSYRRGYDKDCPDDFPEKEMKTLVPDYKR